MYRRFLLADDDTDDSALFCEALSRLKPAGECRIAENGVALFDLLSRPDLGKPDAIFLDINMPLMNGWDCLRKLKGNSEYKDIPTFMYSTSSSKKDIDLAYSLGVVLFVTKPEDFRELCKVLEIVASSSRDSMIPKLKGFQCVKMN